MHSLYDYNDLYRYDLPEQRAVLRGISAAAATLGEDQLWTTAEAALLDVEHAIDVAMDHQVARKTTPQRRAAMDLGRQVDDVVRAIGQTLKVAAQQPAHPAHADAAELLRLALPGGVGGYLRSDRDARQTVAEAMVDVLLRPEQAGAVERTAIGPMVQRLAACNPQLAAALLAAPELEDADAARQRAAEATRHAIYQVLGAFDPRDAAKAARRDAILGELRAVQGRLKGRYAQPASVVQPTAAVCAPMVAQAK